MKRFFVLAVAVVAVAGLGAQALAGSGWQKCTGEYAGYCKYGTDPACNTISIEPGEPWSKADCPAAYQGCITDGGSIFSDEDCKVWTGKGKDPGGVADLGCCKWASDSKAKGNCRVVGDATEEADCQRGVNTFWKGAGKCGDKLTADEDYAYTCPTSAPTYNGGGQTDVVWCSYGACVPDPANPYGCLEGGCYQVAATECGEGGEVVETCPAGTLPPGPSSVRLIANKAATPGLKVSYAKNRVTVNWTPSAKISSGTIQLLNAKGVALSTSYIKANSGKVTAKLATVGVPAGMYFVHISAVGVNGQRIVSQSAVSVVK